MRGAELHRRAKALFLELVALPTEVRGSALREATADDPDLYHEVESLLRHAAAAQGGVAQISLEANGEPARRFEAGDVFADRYRIVAEIGRGASGAVYRALDTRLDVEIALKILRHASPDAIRRLVEETRLARQITHPAVCRVYDVGDSGGEHF